MFSRKKEAPKDTRRRRADGLSKLGLFDIPGIDDSGFGINDVEDDDDAALEAELLALTSGSTPVRPRKKPVAAPPVNLPVNLDTMVAESMRDLSTDEDNESVDENDPALLDELSALVGGDDDEPPVDDIPSPKQSKTELQPAGNSLLSLLQERLKMYENAERNAKSSGEAVRARRFSRGVKTLNDMIKQATAGRVINEEDIPPPVLVSGPKKSVAASDSPSAPERDLPAPLIPTRLAPPPPPIQEVSPEVAPSEPSARSPTPPLDYIEPIGDSNSQESGQSSVKPPNSAVVDTLRTLQNQYKMAALEAKRQGDSQNALKYVRVVKQFEPVIAAAAAGQPVDMTTVPPPPGVSGAAQEGALSPRKADAERQGQGEDTMKSLGEAAEMMAAAAEAAQGEDAADESLFNAPPAPATVLEALEQRLAKYKSTEQAAKEEGNSSKVRRMGRIVKQYESAIKLHKAGKPIPIDELPNPPGFGPIPVEGGGSEAAAAPPAMPVAPVPEKAPSADPVTPASPTIVQPNSEDTSTTPKPNIRKSPQSRQEKQLSLLLVRQKKFKEAALEAKKKGEINQAKEYLRLAKGFDPLIEASQNGLPVDLASIPVPPENKKELETDFDIVTLEDCIPGSDSEIYEKLEQDLLRQTKMCLTTRDHFKATGDIASANRFEQLAVHSKKDLDAVKCAYKRSDPVPKFHYETRSFNIVQCCTELGDNDLELTVVQGINYNVPNPKDVDTYVKFEFPYPTETPVKDRTGLIKDTNNPQYNQTFMLSIQRNVRACQRIFKRQAIKLEVWSRGGFFRSDSLIGTASVKLMPLETKCVIHDAFDLMEGRKAVGGKLEVKVRLRNPILTKQVEQVQEKWLVIDQYM